MQKFCLSPPWADEFNFCPFSTEAKQRAPHGSEKSLAPLLNAGLLYLAGTDAGGTDTNFLGDPVYQCPDPL